MEGIITSPHLSTTLLYDLSQWWSLYLNMCVAASTVKALEAPEARVPFTLDPIFLGLQGGLYVILIILRSLMYFIMRRHTSGTIDDSGGGRKGGRTERQQLWRLW